MGNAPRRLEEVADGGVGARPGLEELHGKLYAIGGHNGETRVSTVERYDPATDRWEAVASLTIARAFLGTASDGHRLWAVGGSDAPGHGLEDLRQRRRASAPAPRC
mgnify:CR=1 FL=1